MRAGVVADAHAARDECAQIGPRQESFAPDSIREHEECRGVVIFLENGERVRELVAPPVIEREDDRVGRERGAPGEIVLEVAEPHGVVPGLLQ